MSITDEMREYTDKLDKMEVMENLDLIADHIDETVASEYVRLPRDADGVPIHVGDVMEWVNDKSVIRTVSGVGAGVFFTWSKDINRYTQCDANAYRHRCEPTVEDVLREMCLEIDRRCERGGIDYDELFAEYAEKLREVIEHDRD